MTYTREKLVTRLTSCDIPEYMHEGLMQWILNGRPVGNFLTAVLENNLREACNRADEANKTRLYNYILFLNNYAPMGCWGDADRTEVWADHQGLLNIDAKEDARRI